MKIHGAAVPLFENIFLPGEQAIISQAQAEQIMGSGRRDVRLSPLKCLVNDNPAFEDQVFTAYKLQVLSPDTCEWDEEFVWAPRVMRVFHACGMEHTLLVTQGSATTPNLAKGIRTHMQKLKNKGFDYGVAQVALAIFDYDLDTMYYGYALEFKTSKCPDRNPKT